MTTTQTIIVAYLVISYGIASLTIMMSFMKGGCGPVRAAVLGWLWPVSAVCFAVWLLTTGSSMSVRAVVDDDPEDDEPDA